MYKHPNQLSCGQNQALEFVGASGRASGRKATSFRYVNDDLSGVSTTTYLLEISNTYLAISRSTVLALPYMLGCLTSRRQINAVISSLLFEF